MRHFILIVMMLGLFLSTSLYGQLTKSEFLLSSDPFSTGGLLFDTYVDLESNLTSAELSYTKARSSQFSLILAPTASYFITDRWVVGSLEAVCFSRLRSIAISAKMITSLAFALLRAITLTHTQRTSITF